MNFKITVVNIFKKKCITRQRPLIENQNSEKKNQIKFLIWKNIKSEIKNSEDWFNTRLDIAKERISKLKDKQESYFIGNSLNKAQ